MGVRVINMAEVLVQVDEKRLDVDPTYDAAPMVSEYRPISNWAMIALLVALAAPLALISPILWIMPIAALIIAIIAVLKTTRGDRPPLGKKRAVFSLILSTFLLGYAPANYIVDRSLLYDQAHRYADEWIALVRDGNLMEAHQLTMTYYDRIAPDEDLAEFYEAKFPAGGYQMRMQMGVNDPHGDLEAFFTPKPLRDMVKAGRDGHYQFVRIAILPDESKPPFTLVDVHYRFTYSDNGTQKTVPLRIKMKRAKLINSGIKHWNVDRVENPDDPYIPTAPGAM